MSGTGEYIIDTSALSRDREVDAVRRALTVLRPSATTFTTDIPWVESSAWPSDVLEAAHSLSDHSRDPVGQYQMTDEIAIDERSWSALVTLAPHVYGAEVWDTTATRIASLDDEGTATWVRMTAEQRDKLTTALGPEVVIPMSEWNARRARRWWQVWRQ